MSPSGGAWATPRARPTLTTLRRKQPDESVLAETDSDHSVTLFGIVTVVFFLVRVLPGDAAVLRAGPYADARDWQR